MHFLSLPVPSTFPFDNRLVEKIGKIIDVHVGFQNDIAAAPAVTPIGTPFWDKLFPTKTDAAAATISSLSEYFDPIDKHNLYIQSLGDNAASFVRKSPSAAGLRPGIDRCNSIRHSSCRDRRDDAVYQLNSPAYETQPRPCDPNRHSNVCLRHSRKPKREKDAADQFR
jgi:hypothetical protein